MCSTAIVRVVCVLVFAPVWVAFPTFLTSAQDLAKPTPMIGRDVEDFLTPDGHFDLEAVRASEYEGPLNLNGFRSWQDSATGELLSAPSSVDGAESVPDDIYWEEGFGLPGVDGLVKAVAVYDGALIIGGDFTVAGSTGANYIAKWDGSSWSALGAGLSGAVNTLTVFNSLLIVGGGFSSAGGAAANYVAAWDGSSWSALGSGVNATVYSLTVFNSQLIAGGNFTDAGGTSATRIAAWNGSSWFALGTGLNNAVLSLTVFNSRLIAGGVFTSAGGTAANRIAAWDGSSWSALGLGTNGNVYALTVFNSQLIAGGNFTTAGGVPAIRIAAWDGSIWSALGDGLSSAVWSLTVFNSQLIAVGTFTTAGGTEANGIAAWNGSSWSPLGTGMNEGVYALSVFNSQLIAGGWFTTAGGMGVSRIAAWDGSSWSALGTGLNGPVYALTVFNSQLIVAGSFTGAGGVPASYIAAWDGSSWTALDAGLNAPVYALTVFNSELIVGGDFTTAGGAPANYIAAWDGTSWSALGSGMSSAVQALTVFNSQLIAGGSFTTAGGTAANTIAAWDGLSWSALGTGTDGNVYALTVFNSQLIVGGAFAFAGGGGVAPNSIAAWDGSSWSALGSGMDSPVYALTVFNSQLVAGGNFTYAGGTAANHTAAWDGSTWSALGSGMNSAVHALTVFNSQLVASGSFTYASGVVANRIASYGGILWSTLGSGLSGPAHALAAFNSKLIVGGGFTTAGGKPSAYFGAWTKSEGSSLQDLIVNGGFEFSPNFIGWTTWGSPTEPIVGVDLFPHTGSKYAYMGEAHNNNEWMYQDVTIPSNATSATLSFWYNINTEETQALPFDNMSVTVRNTSDQVLANVTELSNTVNHAPGTYSQYSDSGNLSEFAGQTVRIHFEVTTNAALSTMFRIDDVSVTYVQPPAARVYGKVYTAQVTPIPISGATVALFQDGSLVNSVLSSSDGSYNVEVLPGVYDIVVSKGGYVSATLSSQDLQSGPNDRDFELLSEAYASLPISLEFSSSPGNRFCDGPTDSILLVARITNAGPGAREIQDIRVEFEKNGILLPWTPPADDNADGLIDAIPLNGFTFVNCTTYVPPNSPPHVVRAIVSSVEGWKINRAIARSLYVSYLVGSPGAHPYTLNRDAYRFRNPHSEVILDYLDDGIVNDYSGIVNVTAFYNYPAMIGGLLAGYSGNCFGMAASSNRYFTHPAEKPVPKETYEMTLDDDGVGKGIVEFHLSQYLSGVVPLPEVGMIGQDVQEAWTDIKAEFASQRPVVIGLVASFGGHAVSAYRMIEDLDTERGYVSIYDNETPWTRPPDPYPDPVMTFDLLSGRVEFSGWGQAQVEIRVFKNMTTRGSFSSLTESLWDWLRVKTVSLQTAQRMSLVIACPVLPLIVASTGQRVGYVDDTTWVNEIGGAVGLEGSLDSVGSLYYFELPSDFEYSVSARAVDSGTVSISSYIPVSESTGVSSHVAGIPVVSGSIVSLSVAPVAYSIDSVHCDFDGNGVPDSAIGMSHNLAPSAFVLISPANYAAVVGPVAFHWHSCFDLDPGDEVSYELVVSPDSSFSDSVIYEVGHDSTFVVAEPGSSSIFYWRVIARDLSGSTTVSLTTESFWHSACGCDHQCDLDGNGLVDAVDLASVIDIVFFGAADVQDPACPATRGDFNNDGVTDAVDLAFHIDYVFFGGAGPADPCAP